MKIKTIKQLKKWENKIVLVRVDCNVPMKGNKVLEDSRILATLPTIKFLLEKKAKVVLISHLGRPDGYDKKLSLKPIADKFEEILNLKNEIFKPLSKSQLPKYFGLVKSEIEKMKGGEIIMLENIRFFSGEEINDKQFAKELAGLGDIFVLDGFAVAHRDAASITGIAKHLPTYAGLLLEKEIQGLSKVMEKPKKPFVLILGGVKMETKLPVLKKLLPKATNVLVGGGIITTFLLAKGYKVGKSVVDKDYKKEALKFLSNKKVIKPVDFVVGLADGKNVKVVKLEKGFKVKNTEAIFDIGPETIRLYAKYIKKAQTIVWNGPMGWFQVKSFGTGSFSVARLVASQSKGKAFGVIGGGETLQVMDMVGMGEYVDLISTGGGAMLEFLSGNKLPGVEIVKTK